MMGVQISLKYGRDPGWFHSLPKEAQVSLLAIERLKSHPPRSSGPASLPPAIQAAIDARQARWAAEKADRQGS